MGKQISRQEAERILEQRFLGKYVIFTYPGKKPVAGRCDRIAIGTGVRDASMVIIIMADSIYKCSPETLKECLKLITPQDGNTHTGRTVPATGPSEEH